jgi:hypothetical protein
LLCKTNAAYYRYLDTLTNSVNKSLLKLNKEDINVDKLGLGYVIFCKDTDINCLYTFKALTKTVIG